MLLIVLRVLQATLLCEIDICNSWHSFLGSPKTILCRFRWLFRLLGFSKLTQSVGLISISQIRYINSVVRNKLYLLPNLFFQNTILFWFSIQPGPHAVIDCLFFEVVVGVCRSFRVLVTTSSRDCHQRTSIFNEYCEFNAM